jgi:hypothetical protein
MERSATDNFKKQSTQRPTTSIADFCNKICQKQTHAAQYDRRKKKDRPRGGLSDIR